MRTCSERCFGVRLLAPTQAAEVLGYDAAGPKPLGAREKQLLGKRQKAVLDFLRENRGPHTSVGRLPPIHSLAELCLSHQPQEPFQRFSHSVLSRLSSIAQNFMLLDHCHFLFDLMTRQCWPIRARAPPACVPLL